MYTVLAQVSTRPVCVAAITPGANENAKNPAAIDGSFLDPDLSG